MIIRLDRHRTLQTTHPLVMGDIIIVDKGRGTAIYNPRTGVFEIMPYVNYDMSDNLKNITELDLIKLVGYNLKNPVRGDPRDTQPSGFERDVNNFLKRLNVLAISQGRNL